MVNSVVEGAFYGILFSGIAFLVVAFLGFSPTSLSVLLYLYVVAGALINGRYRLGKQLDSLLGSIVLVAEEEEVRMRKLFTGEKFVLKGDIERD
ncbi:MAG: hypothetical protein ABEJ83_01460 [Candidatus Nanohaloarchaea archaeon]